MEMYATVVYVISEEVLRILKVEDDPQSKMSNAEVITFAIVTAKFFSGNYKMARYICKKLGLFPEILSSSRLNRRVHNITWTYWHAIFRFLSFLSNKADDICYFAVDSFPVPYCQKNRIDKRKGFLEPEYLGFAASKKRYFCGIKVHMIVTNHGHPIEVQFRPGAESDINVLWTMELDIPPHSILYADGAYNCFDLEDVLQDESIHLLAKRGSKGKNRVRPLDEEKKISSKRQIIETVFSSITNLFPRSIRSRTENGFLIKVFCFVLAYSASFLWQGSLT
jgi:Transposase DDE domain